MVQINMSIPDACSECRLSVRHFGKLYCPYIADRVGNEGKDSRCPLVDAGDQFAEVGKKGDLISRADAVDAISKIKRTDNWQAAVSMALMDLPTAQPEIIRCKDCVLTDGHEPIADGRYWCMLHGAYMYYCSAAERRTDG